MAAKSGVKYLVVQLEFGCHEIIRLTLNLAPTVKLLNQVDLKLKNFMVAPKFQLNNQIFDPGFDCHREIIELA